MSTEDEEIDIWSRESINGQQNYCNLLADRLCDYYCIDDQLTSLRRKIAYALFGPPISTDNNNINSFGYSNSQIAHTKKLVQCLLRISSENNHRQNGLYLAFIFINTFNCKNRCSSVESVIRLMDGNRLNSDNISSPYVCGFMDSTGRFYRTWSAYLNECTYLQDCFVCYPIDGFYRFDDNGKVQVEIVSSTSINSSSTIIYRKLTSTLDTASKVASTTASGMGIASFLVPTTIPTVLTSAAFAAGAAACAYGIARSVYYLCDRKSHRQTLNIVKDCDARRAWISLALQPIDYFVNTSSSSVQTMARCVTAGNILTDIRQRIEPHRTIATTTVFDLGAVCALSVLVDKQELTTNDLLQFSASFLFFSHISIDIDTIRRLIDNTRRQVTINNDNDARRNIEIVKSIVERLDSFIDVNNCNRVRYLKTFQLNDDHVGEIEKIDYIDDNYCDVEDNDDYYVICSENL